MNCKRCEKEFSTEMISERYIQLDPQKYEFCSFCRKYKKCKFCGNEYHHRQNQTCSKKCSEEMKISSYLNSCGTTHNFKKSSISRTDWENKLKENEGIVNVFQRDSVKTKSMDTIKNKYGVDHISKLERVKKSKYEKIKSKMVLDPTFFKKKWWEIHNLFINNLGHDPRLHIFGKASKESLMVFSVILDFCQGIGIPFDVIFIGMEDKSEFFLKDNKNIYFYDFTIRNLQLIIEFHGVAFHAKNESDIWMNPFTNQEAKENIEKRRVKNNLAIRNGFKLLEIWSDDPIEKNIEYCKKFILENYEN